MGVTAFRSLAVRGSVTLAAMTALACAGTLPAYAAQTAHPAGPRLAHMASLSVSRHELSSLTGPSARGRLSRGVRPLACASPDPGASPAISASAYGVEQAYKSDGQLYLCGTFATGYTGLGMAQGTNPSVVALPSGGYDVAFQAAGGDLWVYGNTTGNTNLGMEQYTSPSITWTQNGGYEIAFQSNNGVFWTTGSDGTADWGLGMNPGTSPSIAEVPGGYEAAFQAAGGNLWVAGTDVTGNTNLGMAGYTSPSITGVPGGYEVAFQANTGTLYLTGTDGAGNTYLGMDQYTSPAITNGTSGGYQVAFQANTYTLWGYGANLTGSTGDAMEPGTNPAITEANGSLYWAWFS
jgi:hypothetical protein